MTRSQWVSTILTLLMLSWAILEVRNMNDTLEDESPQLTGLVFRMDGGEVEVPQKVGQTLQELDAEYREAVRVYLSGEGK